MEEIDENKIRKNLKIDAKGVGIASGAAEMFIENVMKELKKFLKSREIITEKDLNRFLVRELKKYNADLAYVYENRDKII